MPRVEAVVFEYALVKGLNDGLENAGELASILRGMNCHVNLIPLNPVKSAICSAQAGRRLKGS